MQSYFFSDIVCQDAARVNFKFNLQSSLISRLLQARRVIRLRPGFACVFWLRVNQLLIRKGWRGQLRMRMWRMYRFANDISPYADIGPGLCLPQLGDNVTVHTGAKVIKPIRIGDNSVIGALALCNKDVPPNSVMYGIPPNVTIKPKG